MSLRDGFKHQGRSVELQADGPESQLTPSLQGSTPPSLCVELGQLATGMAQAFPSKHRGLKGSHVVQASPNLSEALHIMQNAECNPRWKEQDAAKARQMGQARVLCCMHGPTYQFMLLRRPRPKLRISVRDANLPCHHHRARKEKGPQSTPSHVSDSFWSSVSLPERQANQSGHTWYVMMVLGADMTCPA